MSLRSADVHAFKLPTPFVQNVVAVITRQAPDVLSHAAIRARNSGVLMAACCDNGTLEILRNLSGKNARLTPSRASFLNARAAAFWIEHKQGLDF